MFIGIEKDIDVPQCGSAFTKLSLSMCCDLSAAVAEVLLRVYTHTVLVVIIGPYTLEGRIHEVTTELPNIIEFNFVCFFYFKQMVQRMQL